MTELYKLTNGEEIIGVTVGSTGEHFIVKQPMILQFLENSDNSLTGMVLVNYTPFSIEQTVNINRDTVVTRIPVKNNLIDYYEKSIIYNEKVTVKKMIQSLALAITYMDQILDNLEELEKKPKGYKSDKKNKFVIASSTPTSNSIN